MSNDMVQRPEEENLTGIHSFTVLPSHACKGDTMKCRELIRSQHAFIADSASIKLPTLAKIKCGGTAFDGEPCAYARPFVLMPNSTALAAAAAHSDCSSDVDSQIECASDRPRRDSVANGSSVAGTWTRSLAQAIKASCKHNRICPVPEPTASLKEFKAYNHNIVGSFVTYHKKCAPMRRCDGSKEKNLKRQSCSTSVSSDSNSESEIVQLPKDIHRKRQRTTAQFSSNAPFTSTLPADPTGFNQESPRNSCRESEILNEVDTESSSVVSEPQQRAMIQQYAILHSHEDRVLMWEEMKKCQAVVHTEAEDSSGDLHSGWAWRYLEPLSILDAHRIYWIWSPSELKHHEKKMLRTRGTFSMNGQVYRPLVSCFYSVEFDPTCGYNSRFHDYMIPGIDGCPTKRYIAKVEYAYESTEDARSRCALSKPSHGKMSASIS